MCLIFLHVYCLYHLRTAQMCLMTIWSLNPSFGTTKPKCGSALINHKQEGGGTTQTKA